MCRGALIVLEGCDKTGKSTQSKKLFQYLDNLGEKVKLYAFPRRSTRVGKILDDYITKKSDISDQTVHLLFSANRWELISQIQEKLESGVTILVDRYAYSGAAFTAAKGLDLEWCKSTDRGLVKPDMVFYFDIDVKHASVRGDYGNDRYETVEFQEKVQNYFELLKDSTWVVIDANQPVGVIHDKLVKTVLNTLVECKNKRLEKLWIS